METRFIITDFAGEASSSAHWLPTGGTTCNYLKGREGLRLGGIPVNEQMMTIVSRELQEKSGVQAAVVLADLAVSIWHQCGTLLPQAWLQG